MLSLSHLISIVPPSHSVPACSSSSRQALLTMPFVISTMPGQSIVPLGSITSFAATFLIPLFASITDFFRSMIVTDRNRCPTLHPHRHIIDLYRINRVSDRLQDIVLFFCLICLMEPKQLNLVNKQQTVRAVIIGGSEVYESSDIFYFLFLVSGDSKCSKS